jgi:molecular chaperone GrpE
MATDEKNVNEVPNGDAATSDTPVEDFEEVSASTEDAPVEDTVDSLRETVEALKTELQEEKDRYLRLYSEFQNYRNRTTKEKTESYNNATAKCIEEILPVVDNFERALVQECSDESYKNGMEMIFKHLVGILDRMGVKEIESLGKPFDPKVHNAINKAQSDELESDTVCAVFQKGYTLNEKIIRPAMVQVVE